MGASSSCRIQDPTEKLAPMGRSYEMGRLVSKSCGPSQWQIPLGPITGYHAIHIVRRGDAGRG